MDEADRTQMIDEVYQEAAMRSLKARRASGPHILTTGEIHCIGCGKAIPAERRKANPEAIRCIECQTKSEAGGNT